MITGPAAGSQGPVTIHVACNGTALTPDFDIAAGKPAGTYSQTWTGIPAGSTCTVTEPVNGGTSTVSVTTVGSPQDVTVGAAQGAEATISNTYDFTVGSLKVTKTITGPASYHQGQVTIKVSCDGTELSPELCGRCRRAVR